MLQFWNQAAHCGEASPLMHLAMKSDVELVNSGYDKNWCSEVRSASSSLPQPLATFYDLRALAVDEAMSKVLASSPYPNLFSPGSVKDCMQRDPKAVVSFISETRKIIQSSYSCPKTLIVRFSDDSIDESLQLQQILKAAQQGGSSRQGGGTGGSSRQGGGTGGSSRQGGGTVVTLVELPGSHLTPCGGDFDLRQALQDLGVSPSSPSSSSSSASSSSESSSSSSRGGVEGGGGGGGSSTGGQVNKGVRGMGDPFSFALQGLEVASDLVRVQSQNDIRRLSGQVLQWMDKQEDA